MIQLGKFNPIFFNPRKYKYGTGEYTQRFDVDDFITFEFFSGNGETAQVYLNNLSTGGRQAVDMTTFSLSESVDVHYASLQPGEGYYSVTIGGDVNVESEPFCVCQCKEGTTLLEYSNASNNVDGGVFINGEKKIPFMFRFEGGIMPVDTEYHCDNEYFRNQRQEIRHLYTSSYEVLKLTVGDTSMGCPEWYASFFNKVLNLSDIKIGGETLARSEGSTPEKTQMQEGSGLIYFTINVEADGSTVAGGDGNFNQGGGGGFSVYIITTNDLTEASDKNVFSALRTILEISSRALSKQREDTTEFLLRLMGGIITNNIESEGFTTGALGAGFLIKRDPQTGKSYIEVDELFVRMKAFFTELEIKKLSYAGGNFIFSPAGITLSKVETVTGDSGKAYRCYFTNDDGSTATDNLFRVDDLVMCQTFNVKAGKYENVSNKRYWRAVVAVGDNYFDLSDTDCEAGSAIPADGDSVVVLGNHSDTSRQNALVISVYGEGSPSLTQHSGIHTYSLDGTEKIRISPNGNLFTGEFRVSTGETVEDYINSLLGNLDFNTGENLLINSKLDNTDGWTMDYQAQIEDFEGYKCLNISGTNIGFSTTPAENARLVPWGATVTNSVDVYATAECDIKLGFASKPNDIHITELNKWVRVSITQELDEGNPSFFYIMGGSGSSAANVHVKEAKCEKGTEATPWKPSIYDIDLVEQKVQSQLTMTKDEIRLEVEQQITNVKSEVSEEVDAKLSVAAGEIKSEVNSVISSLGSAGDNIVKNGNVQESPGYGNPGFIELYKNLVKGNTYTVVMSAEWTEGHEFQLCDSMKWDVQGEFEQVTGHIHTYINRFTYDPQSNTLEHDKLYLRVEPEDGYPWDLFWICIYEGNVIPPYSFVPAPQEQESGAFDIGVRNLLLNSKLDNLEGWSRNIDANASQIVVFDGYTCLRVSGNYRGLYTQPTQNARLIPADGVITSSIDVYATAVCDIVFGRQGLPNTVHITEANKWIRVHNTQTLDGTKNAFIIYTISETTTVYFKDAKCETGTVPTGWTPAPEDLKGFDGQNLVVRGRYNITDNANYQIRGVYLSKDLTVGKTYTAVLSGDVGGSQQFGLWDSTSLQQQGLFTKKSGRIYTLTFVYKKRSDSNANTLVLYNYPKETCAANPADVDWLCIYETRSDIPQVFVPAPEDDCTLTAWGGHNGAEKSEVVVGDHAAQTQTGRGFHLWRLDIQTMRLAAVGRYDVYSTTGDAKTQFVTALNGIGSGYLAIVTSCDAITIDTAIQTALRDFGADAPLMTQARMSFVLVGKKGIGAGNGVMKTSAVSAASVTVRIIEGVCMDFFSGGGLAEWKEETTAGIQNLKEQVTLYAQKVTTVEGTVTTMRSELDVLPGQISSKVSSTDFNGNNIVSRINQTATTITIDASKINLVGKVSIGMLDGTIIENGKIKTSLISVQKIEAVEGTISGFEISSDHIGMAEGTAGGPEGLSLYSYRLSIGEPNCRAWIGSRIMSGSSTYEAMAGRFEVNKSSLGENIGIYISVQGSKPYDDTQDTGNAALHIAKGAIYGTRFRLRTLEASATISVMDTFIVAATTGIRITLPSSPEDGQFFFITNRSSGDITVYCANKLCTGNTAAKSSSANLQRGKAAFVYYDSSQSAYQCHWLGNWDN